MRWTRPLMHPLERMGQGTPTGPHRYVGEQRFVFALLNVTDGVGDLVSYDFNGWRTYGGYEDFSGNGLYGATAAETLTPAYFGRGMSLPGSGNYPLVGGTGAATKLNWINDSFTVAFWIRPDTDYVNGSGWAWSFGRQGLWRLGFNRSAQGVAFEVTIAGGQKRTVQSACPLYAGRWVHIAGVMRRVTAWTVLDLYVNGERIATQAFIPYFTAMDSSTVPLYLGWDQASGSSAKFTGIVDELRPYKTALAQDSIKGLLWFLKGSDSLVIPRGVFYSSKMCRQLNDSATNFSNANSPLADAKVYGNSNTLAQAFGILDLARTNSTGHVTAFPFFATSEFYTLGFVDEVNSLVANTSVVNGGNCSMPPPAANLWRLY